MKPGDTVWYPDLNGTSAVMRVQRLDEDGRVVLADVTAKVDVEYRAPWGRCTVSAKKRKGTT